MKFEIKGRERVIMWEQEPKGSSYKTPRVGLIAGDSSDVSGNESGAWLTPEQARALAAALIIAAEQIDPEGEPLL